MRVDEPGSARRLTGLPGKFNTPIAYAPDGRGILVRTQGTETRQDLVFVSLADSIQVQLVLATKFNELTGSISPDGRWLAYISDESGQLECRVRRFPTGTGAVTVVSQGAWADPAMGNRIGTPRWRRDGRELVYAAAGGRTLMAVDVTPGDLPSFGTPRPRFRIPGGAADLDATPDLDRFLVTIPLEEEGRSTATLILNWPRLVEKGK